MAARGPAAQAPRRLPLAQINEDFARIQVLDNALAQASAAGDELDFKLVARAASEIKKRAGRLKNNLLLPQTDEVRPRTSDAVGPGQLKGALTALDALIISFVSNPGFRSVKVVDTEWPAQARRDLDEIIELSGRIKQSCEQSHRAAQKSR
ncbi:MAG: hypothetical protein ABR563_03495 [Pyrinomonadaceae bacterium]